MPLYFITYVVIFWIPMLVLGGLLWGRLRPSTKKAFWITNAIMVVVSTVMEFVYIKLDVWGFSQAIDPLLGIWIWKIPIEEFVFWFGATPLFLFMYLGFERIHKKV